MWDSEHIFNGDRTVERDFHLLNGGTVSTSLMISVQKYHCKSFSDFKVLKIPYRKGELAKFSMFFFLPDGRYVLPYLLEKLSDSPREDYFDLEEVKFKESWIAKFDIRYDFDVPATMKKKGIVFPSMEIQKTFRRW
ncbi:hypothetical protein Vadar_006848 [Vaccinium darrowii]|uniref:Uncharacterized protein n=1 Tax=Vaccinium darrowii TaxID=229202 RepID=A0ACB7YJV9_9ERIC|nr:hypothetical protein Vadar_006848 [Vaccinium darrowii]